MAESKNSKKLGTLLGNNATTTAAIAAKIAAAKAAIANKHNNNNHQQKKEKEKIVLSSDSNQHKHKHKKHAIDNCSSTTTTTTTTTSTSSDSSECSCHQHNNQHNNPEIRVFRTAFVDKKFGNDKTGKLTFPAFPFKTITAAINKILRFNPTPNPLEPSWTIIVSAGNYIETINLPSFINLRGEGVATTITGSITINSPATVSTLVIIGTQLPAITVLFDQGGVNGQVLLDHVNLTVSDLPATTEANPAVKIQQINGANGAITIRDSNFDIDLTANTIATGIAVQASGGAITTVENSNVNLSVLPTTVTSVVQALGGKITVLGGQILLIIINVVPTNDVAIFDALNDGNITISDNIASVLEEILAVDRKAAIASKKQSVSSYKSGGIKQQQSTTSSKKQSKSLLGAVPNQIGNVIYARVQNVSLINALDTTLDFESVPSLDRILAQVIDLSSSINVLNVKTLSTFVPSIQGIVANIRYVAISGDGNIVSSGGLYNQIVTVNTTSVGSDNYFVQDNDEIILVSDPPVTVTLEDPTVVNQEVLYKGKKVTVKNITAASLVTVTGPIFDGITQLLAPNQVLTFQNNGILWYIIGH